MAARAVVFGIIAAFLGVFIVVITIVLLMRGIQALLDLVVTKPQAVYLSYFIVGGILCLGGLLLFRKRSRQRPLTRRSPLNESSPRENHHVRRPPSCSPCRS